MQTSYIHAVITRKRSYEHLSTFCPRRALEKSALWTQLSPLIKTQRVDWFLEYLTEIFHCLRLAYTIASSQLETGVHKSLARSRKGDKILYSGAYCLWLVSMKLSLCRHSSAPRIWDVARIFGKCIDFCLEVWSGIKIRRNSEWGDSCLMTKKLVTWITTVNEEVIA